MLGIIYIILCFSVGWAICTFAFPNLAKLTERDFLGRVINLSPYLLFIPAWYIVGTLAMTWPTYLIAYLFGNKAEPLFYANSFMLPFGFLVTGIVFYLKFRQNNNNRYLIFCGDRKTRQIELVLILAIALLASILMWTTFFVSGDRLFVGVSVFSDFSPHIGMIRSFSYGNNFPTQYSHYAGQDIRYHFLFQFLTGNLEYLGLRIDYAFNISSIISFISAFSLLYVLAVKMTGKIKVGVLSCLFFAFRSSKSLFTYLANLPQGTNVLKALSDNTEFISDTPNENWGLWNLNVYCNQRHLAFGLAVMFFILILFMPLLFDMFNDRKQYLLNKKEDGQTVSFADRFIYLFLTKEGWYVKDLRTAVSAGVILGSIAFFHGAAQVCCILILFVMAIVSKRRSEYIITAVITVFMAVLQTKLFIHDAPVTTSYLFGFIAENKTIFGVASYLDRLLGILPLVILAAFCLEKGARRYLILAFTAPLVFAFTVSLTIDVTVNHKYIMMSCILLGIIAASFVAKLLEQKDYAFKFVGVLLIVALTSTGIYDFYTVINKNQPNSAIVLDLDSELTKWIDDHSDSKDIFLTSNYALNQVVLGGAMLYEGWPYFPWSAGYDTDTRSKQVKLMYEASTPKELDSLIKKNHIRFIIVDQDNRNSQDYAVNEENIKATYQSVYHIGEGEGKTTIYDTEKPVK
jgi:hypothetical protein